MIYMMRGYFDENLALITIPECVYPHFFQQWGVCHFE